MSPAVPFHQLIQKDLQDPEFVRGLLNECLQDETPGVFLSALRDVAKANNISMSDLSRKIKLNRRSLYRVLSEGGNPTFETLQSILAVLGFRLSIQIIHEAS